MSFTQIEQYADSHYDLLGGTKLRLVHPTSYVDGFEYAGATGAIRVELAKFGHFQTGTSIQAPLFMPPVAQDGCSEMTPEDHISQQYNMDWKGFVIVLDGGCTYETKARNVQSMGAQALIIAQDSNAFIPERMDHVDNQQTYDGSGSSVLIPTLLVHEDDAERLLFLVRGKPNFDEAIVLKADIEISDESSQTISYSLFYGSIVDLDPTLILRMYEYQHALGDKAVFIPRIMTFECVLCPQEVREQHCVSDGNFCFTPPNDEIANKFPAVTDRQLIVENLRELCIYDMIGDKRDEQDDHIFFNYLYNMHFMCLNKTMELTDQCAEQQMDELGIDVKAIQDCMRVSFDDFGNWDSYNELLYRDRMHANDIGITLNPSLAINGHPYTGPMHGEEIFSAICQAYRLGHMPEVCDTDFDIQMAIGHMDDFQPPSGAFGHEHLIAIIVLAVVFNLGLICWCIRRKKKDSEEEIQSQVQMQVEKYFKLQNNDVNF